MLPKTAMYVRVLRGDGWATLAQHSQQIVVKVVRERERQRQREREYREICTQTAMCVCGGGIALFEQIEKKYHKLNSYLWACLILMFFSANKDRLRLQ